MDDLTSVKLRRPLPPDSYLRALGPVRYLMAGNALTFDRPVTFLVGENGARIYLLDQAGIRPVEYRETEHYQLTRRFLEDPERMLRYLLDG